VFGGYWDEFVARREHVSSAHSKVGERTPAFSNFQPCQWERVQKLGSAACLKNEKPMYSMWFRCGFTFLVPGPFPYNTLPQKDKVAICTTEELGRAAWLSCPGCSLQVLQVMGAGLTRHGEESCPRMGHAESNPVLPSAVPDICAASSAASSLMSCPKPVDVAKFKVLVPAVPEFVPCSEAPGGKGKGMRVGQPLPSPIPSALFFLWMSVFALGPRAAVQAQPLLTRPSHHARRAKHPPAPGNTLPAPGNPRG